jgi:hypothetical protein
MSIYLCILTNTKVEEPLKAALSKEPIIENKKESSASGNRFFFSYIYVYFFSYVYVYMCIYIHIYIPIMTLSLCTLVDLSNNSSHKNIYMYLLHIFTKYNKWISIWKISK